MAQACLRQSLTLMLVSIKSRAQWCGFLLGCVALSIAYISIVVRAGRAARLSSILQPASLDRALALEPDNSEYVYRRGALALYGDQDPGQAIPYFERAVALNPYRSRYWLSLASSWSLLGDRTKEKSAIESAVVAEPTDPTIVWDAANLMMVSGDTQRALSLYRSYVEVDPGDSSRAYDVCWRALQNADVMLARVVPPTTTARMALLQYLVKHDAIDGAIKVWKSALELRQPLAGEQALTFIDALLQKRLPVEASAAWRTVLERDPRFAAYASAGNLLVNSRFENAVLNHAFDWRIVPNPAVMVAVDVAEFHGGGNSLSFSFSGDPLADTGVFQYVEVEPSTTYQFSAYAKSDELYSAAGPRFVVEDAYDSHNMLATDAIVGTSGWKHVHGTFQTGAVTHLVALRVTQERNVHIKGNFWIGDLSLTRE